MTELLGHPQKQEVGGIIQLHFRGLKQELGQWAAEQSHMDRPFDKAHRSGETNYGALRYPFECLEFSMPEGQAGH